ncbi:hypothetical protein AMJ47_03030 [Parcubacteria bacterium DG_72]|nr:MAG: hypothetical protein AMJ47_03030 [Parcubacteria bacterium DG_72]
MKKIIIGGITLLFTFAALPTVAAWDVTGTYTWLVLGTYSHDLVIGTQNADGTFLGTGGYPSGSSPYTNPGQTPETITGQVTGDQITFTTTYAGPYNPGYSVTVSGTIASDGTMSGNSPWEWHTTSGAAQEIETRYAEITSPNEGGIVTGTLDLAAYLVDDDQDSVQWAVRKGTCAAGTNTVFGNVDGFNDPFNWTYDSGTGMHEFTAQADISSWEPGMYCFIFNPREDSGEEDIRLTREFEIEEEVTYKNHGQYVKSQENKKEAAQSRIGMPIKSKGHTK